MANINKSFNFRNGVQVDYDNFIVNPNGLVGIGTSIPREFLDVYGTARITGLVTTRDLHVTGFSTFTEVRLGSGIKMSSNSGIITATAFYGDGGTLTNLPTSQWIDVSPSAYSVTSIYSAGNVGVATTNPGYTFQVGGNPDIASGVGFNSTGSIKASGIITAGYFSGDGSLLTTLNASNITSGTISNNYLPVINNDKFPSNISVSGIITASTNFNGNITGNVTGNVNSTGLSTFSGGIVGNVTGTASTAQSLTGTPNISVGAITASSIDSSGFLKVQTSVNVGNLGTSFNVSSVGRVGIGTSIPTSDLQIRKSSGSLLEVISDSGQSRISIGQSVGIGKSTAILRFGFASKTFDIINNDTGNINSYLHNGEVGINTGKFRWIYGQNNDELMSLNYDGTLTVPGDVELGTSGISSVTVNDDLFVSGDLIVDGTLTASIDYPDVIDNTNLNNIAGITTLRFLNATNIGINSSNPTVGLDAKTSVALFSSVGINTVILGTESLACDGFGRFNSIGIGTTTLYEGDVVTGSFQIHNSALRIFNGSLLLTSGANDVTSSKIGFGTHRPRSILDFGIVGGATSIGYFIPPSVSTSNRDTFADNVGLTTVEGAIIYNTTTKKHQGYGSLNGGTTYGWQDLY
jgi:hypothetical protein